MSRKEMNRYISKVALAETSEKKQKYALMGLKKLFSFERHVLFSYSSVNHVGESIVLIDNNKKLPVDVKEDFSVIPAMYSSIESKHAKYYSENELPKVFPERHIHKYGTRDLCVIPIVHHSAVIGCVTVRKPADDSVYSDKVFMELLTMYGKLIGQVFEGKSLTFPNLSQREIEVLQRMAWGESNKTMADHMNISEHTVRDYVKSLLIKLKAEHRAHAVAEAIRKGIIV